MKKLITIVAAGLLACLAFSSVATAAMKPADEQDWEGKIFAGAKPGKTPSKGSVGSYLHPYHRNTWPGVKSKKTGSVLVSPPFATAFADVYLDKNLEFNPDPFPGCSLDKVLAIDPDKPGPPADCPKESFLGSGTAAVACAVDRRAYIGIEIDDKHFAKAVDRITKELERLALFEPPPKIVQRSLIDDGE